MRGQQEFINLYKVLDCLSIDSERAQKGHIFKIKCLRQIYSSKNFMSKGYKPLSIKLTGHKDKVTSISCLGDHILSGSRDKLVKLWNIKTKKCITYNDHMNWITKVLFIDNFAISGSADKYVKIRPLNNIMESQSSYKHNGHITGLYKIDDSKIISICSNGQLIMFDLFLQRQMFVDETKDFVFDYFSHNEDLVCTYSSSQSKGVIRDLHTMKTLCTIDTSDDDKALTPPPQVNTNFEDVGTLKITDSNIFILGEYNSVRMWDLRASLNKRPLEEFKQPESSVINLYI